MRTLHSIFPPEKEYLIWNDQGYIIIPAVKEFCGPFCIYKFPEKLHAPIEEFDTTAFGHHQCIRNKFAVLEVVEPSYCECGRGGCDCWNRQIAGIATYFNDIGRDEHEEGFFCSYCVDEGHV